jgi:hypothetical protein
MRNWRGLVAAFAVLAGVVMLAQRQENLFGFRGHVGGNAVSTKLMGELDRAERLGAACDAGQNKACSLVYAEIDRLGSRFNVLQAIDSTSRVVFEVMSRLDELEMWRLTRLASPDARRAALQYRLWAKGNAATGDLAAARAHLQRADDIERTALAQAR